MANKTVKTARMDLQKIFLTPPNTRKEKITFFILLLMLFILFFAPVCFSTIHPVRAVLMSCAPALSLSWGWTVLMRSLFRKKEFSRECR